MYASVAYKIGKKRMRVCARAGLNIIFRLYFVRQAQIQAWLAWCQIKTRLAR